jgi:hypothetical protein
MRILSEAVLAALEATNPKFFLLAEVNFSPVLRMTSTPYDITYNGQVFSALSPLVSFSPPRVSTSVDREIYELVFLDHDNFFQSELRKGVNGKILTVYAGFFNSEDQPLLDPNDVFIAYQGFVDSGKVVNDGSYKQAILAAASPMAALDSIGGYIVSKDGMDQVSSTDTSFDDVYVGGKSINLKWGKA